MPVRPDLIPPSPRAAPVTGAGRAATAVVFLAVLLASSPLLPGRGADGALPPLPPAAPFFSAAGGASVLLVRVYPNAARDDEFVEIVNAGPAAVDLAGWSLTDREERATFPAFTSLAPGARLVATRNATSYAEDERRPADFTYDRGDAARMGGGVLRLADTGDEVLLCDAVGRVVDAYVYGASDYAGDGWSGPPAAGPGRGEIATRGTAQGAWDDTDAAEDWDGIRAYRLGQSAFVPPALEVTTQPVVLVSPDDGRGRVLSFLASADRTLEAAVYTLTSDAIACVLADRARAGVRVRVLLEGSPVGGVDEDEQRLVAYLVDAGVQVRSLSGGLDAVKRYRYLHAKYAVVDGAAVLVSSENFGDSGFPSAGGSGNRGWSAIVEDRALAGQLWEVFEDDFDPSRPDSVPETGERGVPPETPPVVPPWSPTASGGALAVQLLVGPDNVLTDRGVLGLLASARERVRIEAFYADDPWGSRPSPLLEAAFAAARRGVSVRLLLDGGEWSAEEDTAPNVALAAALNDRARDEGVPLEARVFTATGRVERIHNKGAVVDGRRVLISSMNWARGSATDNREIGLLLDDVAAAARLEEAFDRDWEGRLDPPAEDLTIADPTTLLAVYAFIAAASGASLRKMRRRDKGLKRRPRLVPRGLFRAALRGGNREVRLLPPELVAEPRAGAGGGARNRGGGEEALGGLRGPEGHRGP